MDRIEHYKRCIEVLEKGINICQKISEVCAISITRDCAAQLGLAVGICNKIIDACNECIIASNENINHCSDIGCTMVLQNCIKSCREAIQKSKECINMCKADDRECFDISIDAVNSFSACSQAYQACIDAMTRFERK